MILFFVYCQSVKCRIFRHKANAANWINEKTGVRDIHIFEPGRDKRCCNNIIAAAITKMRLRYFCIPTKKNMMNRLICLAIGVCLVTTACKKEKTFIFTPPPPPPPPNTSYYDDYMALKPGNYWIYEHYELDSAQGAAHAMGTYDSAYVEKDTVINRRVYHVYNYRNIFSNEKRTRYLRDSLSYTVELSGRIIFSSDDFTTVFRTYQFGPDGVTNYSINVTEQMGSRNQTTVVDAGTFTTSSFIETYTFPADYEYGPTRQYEHRYAKGVGLIRETAGFYESSPKVYEKRLVRYKVKKKY